MRFSQFIDLNLPIEKSQAAEAPKHDEIPKEKLKGTTTQITNLIQQPSGELILNGSSLETFPQLPKLPIQMVRLKTSDLINARLGTKPITTYSQSLFQIERASKNRDPERRSHRAIVLSQGAFPYPMDLHNENSEGDYYRKPLQHFSQQQSIPATLLSQCTLTNPSFGISAQ